MLGRTAHTSKTKTAKKAFACLLAVFALFVFSTGAAQAQPQFGLEYGSYTGLTSTDIRVTIGRIIQIALGLLGIVAVLIVLYAGFLWMTAAGNEERVETAKKTLSAGIIGLIIIASAFAIASFIISRLLDATGQGGSLTGGGGDGLGGAACIGLSATCPSGALGSGIVDSHFPNRSATGVPRNTRIVVTFKQAMNPASITVGPAGTVAVLKSSEAGVSPRFEEKFARSIAADAFEIATTDNKTFVFIQKRCSKDTPDGCIGEPSADVFYTVGLRGGSSGIKKADGKDAFTGQFSSGYLWEFQVSTNLDLLPPKVTAVVPADGSDGNPRNTLVQVNFSEAVDPLSVAVGFSLTRTGTIVRGENMIGNGYRSMEFRSDESCGVNSCGETIYCLPGDATLTATVKADGLASAPTGVYPPNGITDMAGNSLDGDGDGAAEGPPADDRKFTFATNDEIDLVPPKIVAQEPEAVTGNIPRDLKVAATFSKLMSVSSLTTESAALTAAPGGAPVNYYVFAENLSSVQGGAADRTKAGFGHDLFAADQPYAAAFSSGLRDLRQNCFSPPSASGACTGRERFCCNGIPTDDENDFRARCGIPAP